MTKTFSIITLIIAVIMVFVLYWFTSFQFSLDANQKVVGQLLQLSSLVFAITGIWLGIGYPKVITDIFKNGYSLEADSKTARGLKKIFAPLRISVFNIMIAFTTLLLLNFSSETIISTGFKYYDEMAALVTVLTLYIATSQLYATYLTLKPAMMIVKTATGAAAKNEQGDNQSSLAKPKDKSS